jgi:hypothetical protein
VLLVGRAAGWPGAEAAGALAGRAPDWLGVEVAGRAPAGGVPAGRPPGWPAGVLVGRAGAEAVGAAGVVGPVGRGPPETGGGPPPGRPADGLDAGRLDGPGVEPGTFGVPAGRWPALGWLERGVEVPALPETVGVPGERVPPGVAVERGVALLELLLTRGLELLPRSPPAWRTRVAFDWSVVRAAWAVSLTFWPVVSAEAAARSVPALAVLMASSALIMATWPNTPALWADAPMLSLPPTPSRIWLPRPENRPPIDSTASGSMLEPLPGATPPGPGLPVPGEPLDPLLWLPEELLPEEPEEPLRLISPRCPGSPRGSAARPAASRTA